jgi:hypothetical protein
MSQLCTADPTKATAIINAQVKAYAGLVEEEQEDGGGVSQSVAQLKTFSKAFKAAIKTTLMHRLNGGPLPPGPPRACVNTWLSRADCVPLLF